MRKLAMCLNQSVNDKGVCRTAPATPGLLVMTVCSLSLANLDFLGIPHFADICEIRHECVSQTSECS